MSAHFSKIPTTLITGFLGSGKTTIISHLLDDLSAKKQKVVYIKNEIGDFDLDGKLLQGKVTATKELLNGCICCTLVGSLVSSIDELIERYHPDRFVIESSGSADPVALALTISNHPRLYRDGVIAIIDVVNFSGYKDLSEIARQEARFTDLIVFNKGEFVDAEQKKTVVGYVRELNAYSPIIEAKKGKVPLSLLIGIDSTLEFSSEKTTSHIHSDHIDTISFTTDKKMDIGKITQAIKDFPENVFRVKGIIITRDGPLVINAAYKRVDSFVPPEGIEPQTSHLMLVGYDIAFQELDLQKKLQACIATESS